MMTEPYWKADNLTVYYGDCLKVMSKFPCESIDLIITSPPYNVGKDYGNETTDDLTDKKYLAFTESWLDECARLLKTGGRICIVVGEITKKSYFAHLVTIAESFGLNFRNTIIWHIQSLPKRTGWGSWNSPSNPYTVPPFQYIFVLSKTYKSHSGEKSDLTKDEFLKYTYGMWDFSFEHNKLNPSAFPEELPHRCIKLFSYIGDTILDPFLGSGTTLKVCQKLNRQGIGIEIEKKYCDIAKQRLAERVLI